MQLKTHSATHNQLSNLTQKSGSSAIGDGTGGISAKNISVTNIDQAQPQVPLESEVQAFNIGATLNDSSPAQRSPPELKSDTHCKELQHSDQIISSSADLLMLGAQNTNQ